MFDTDDVDEAKRMLPIYKRAVDLLETVSGKKTEQAEQEPVARYYGEKLVKGSRVFELIDRNLAPDTPLYAAPVRTKYLTDDEIADIRMSIVAYEPVEWGRVFARAVIAKFKEKNRG